jgi:hypothetical protein
MSIDISTELDVINSNLSGELVALNIANAAKILSDHGYETANVDELLGIIKNGTYGIDIRQAIYETLKRLSMTNPTDKTGKSLNNLAILLPNAHLNPAINGIAVLIEE